MPQNRKPSEICPSVLQTLGGTLASVKIYELNYSIFSVERSYVLVWFGFALYCVNKFSFNTQHK